MRRRMQSGHILLSAIGVLMFSGCGGPALPPMVPVEGKVMVDNVPVTSGQVSFMAVAVGDPNKPVPPSNGQIDGSGNYKLFTGGKAGAPAGKYKVTVTPSMVPVEGAKEMPKAPFHEKYRDLNKTTLEINVAENAAAGSYDLKLSK